MPFSAREIVMVAFEVYSWLVFLRVLLSWFPVNPYNPVIKFIHETTEPLLEPLRRVLPPSPSMPIDFSPILAIFVLQFLRKMVLLLIDMVL